MAEICYTKMATVLVLLYLVNIVEPHKELMSSFEMSANSEMRPDSPHDNVLEQSGGLDIDISNNAGILTNDLQQQYFNAPMPTEPPATFKPYDRVWNHRNRRIYNPDEVATIEEFPFMAALLVNNQLWCGGAIIEPDKVLTAAHCLQLQYNNRFFREYVKMLTVRVGSTNATAGGELLRVTEIFFHPNYKPQSLEFNFAVLKLHKNLTFKTNDEFVDAIQISTDSVVPIDHDITFLGWGSVLGITGKGGEVLLQKVTLPVYDISDCQDIYGRNLVTRHNFCAGYITIPKNVCNHDAGGPAIMDNQLVGILSFSSKRCDRVDQPAVFSTVSSISDWLAELGDKRFRLRETAIKPPDSSL